MLEEEMVWPHILLWRGPGINVMEGPGCVLMDNE